MTKLFAHDNLQQAVMLLESSPSTGPNGEYFEAEWLVAGVTSQELTGQFSDGHERILAQDLAARTDLDISKPYLARYIGLWEGNRVFAFRSEPEGSMTFIDIDVEDIADPSPDIDYFILRTIDYSVKHLRYLCFGVLFCGWYDVCDCRWVPWYCFEGTCRQSLNPPAGVTLYYDPYECEAHCFTGTGTGTGNKWYCLRNTSGTHGCYAVTEEELADLLDEGYEYYGGPYDYEYQCVEVCQTGTGTGTGSGTGVPDLGCCDPRPGDTLYATFSGALAPLGTVTLTHFGISQDQTWSGSSTACDSKTVNFLCQGGVYVCMVTSTDPFVGKTYSCSPFHWEGDSPNSVAPCAGASSVVITDTPP